LATDVATTRKRLLVVLIILVALMALLIFRVGYWNIVRGEWLQSQALTQWISDSPVNAKRGSIMDRNMNVLAQSAVSDTVVLMPQQIKDPAYVADMLSQILEMPRSEVLYKAATKVRENENGEETQIGEVWLKRQITNDQSERINALEMAGVKLIDDVTRYYPNKELAAQVVGYTTADGEGQTGIERRYNNILEGRQGRMVAETDKLHNDIPNGMELFIEPEDGKGVVLTIDAVTQNFLETACGDALSGLAADSVQGVIMDVTTGEILALANTPEFDLNEPPRSDGTALSEMSANIVTASAFEPGSIFNVIVAAGAYDAGVAAATYNCTGVAEWHGEEIMCSGAHGAQTFEEAVVNGCSVAAAQMASDMGKQTFYDYMARFGLGEKTGVDYTTDTAGEMMALKYASDSDIAKMGAGEGLKLSQLQLIGAAASIINGGTLYVPRLVYGLANDDGEIEEAYSAEVKSTSVSAETSETIKKVMQTILATGAREAQPDGYTAGALYGINEKYDSDGNMDIGKSVSVFMEFAPVSSPKYAVMITLNGVASEAATGMTAAPYVKRVMDEVLQYMLVPPDGGNTASSASEPRGGTDAGAGDRAEVPNVAEMGLAAAAETLEQAGFRYQADGAGTVVEQNPAAGTMAEPGAEVELLMDHKISQPESQPISAEGQTIETVVVPDFAGLSTDEAMSLGISSGLRFYAQGDGIARKQYPVAGTTVQKGSPVTVRFVLDLE
jgi:stage V sporulation protein D (sporulation-specific penicillin-binding protein)